MPELKLTVNGIEHSLDVPHSRFLAEVLRYDLGLTGTKIGCNEAECGACTVIVDGQSVDSCLYPAFKAQGSHVLTIEGVAAQWRQAVKAQGSNNGDALHPCNCTLAPSARGFHRPRRDPMRLLHPRLHPAGQDSARRQPRPQRRRDQALSEGHLLPLHRLRRHPQRGRRPRRRSCAPACCPRLSCPRWPKRWTRSASRWPARTRWTRSPAAPCTPTTTPSPACCTAQPCAAPTPMPASSPSTAQRRRRCPACTPCSPIKTCRATRATAWWRTIGPPLPAAGSRRAMWATPSPWWWPTRRRSRARR